MVEFARVQRFEEVCFLQIVQQKLSTKKHVFQGCFVAFWSPILSRYFRGTNKESNKRRTAFDGVFVLGCKLPRSDDHIRFGYPVFDTHSPGSHMLPPATSHPGNGHNSQRKTMSGIPFQVESFQIWQLLYYFLVLCPNFLLTFRSSQSFPNLCFWSLTTTYTCDFARSAKKASLRGFVFHPYEFFPNFFSQKLVLPPICLPGC